MARVYLKPGARGLQPKKSRSKFNDSSYSRRRSTNDANSFADGTVMEMGNDIDISSSVAGQRTSIPSNNKQHQLIFQFAIGSVESFERKLDEAQRELGIDQRHFIPVQYASNSSVSKVHTFLQSNEEFSCVCICLFLSQYIYPFFAFKFSDFSFLLFSSLFFPFLPFSSLFFPFRFLSSLLVSSLIFPSKR